MLELSAVCNDDACVRALGETQFAWMRCGPLSDYGRSRGTDMGSRSSGPYNGEQQLTHLQWSRGWTERNWDDKDWDWRERAWDGNYQRWSEGWKPYKWLG